MKSVLLCSGLATTMLFAPGHPAAADPVGLFTLYETATLGPIGQSSGSTIASHQFLGARFQVDQRVMTATVGGHFFGSKQGDIFGAIVSLTGPADFPDSFDLSTDDVVGGSRIPMGQDWPAFFLPSREFSAPLRAALTPGWYGLIFGSGLFGTSGIAGLVFTDLPVGRPSTFFTDVPSRVWSNVEFPGGARMFVTAAPVPEPSTLLLLGGGLAALARRRLRALRTR